MKAGAQSGRDRAVPVRRTAGPCAPSRRLSGIALLLLTVAFPASAQPSPPHWPPGPALAEIAIELRPAEEDSLRRHPRRYVRATVRANGEIFRDAGIHLKGAVGSFQPYDDRPSITVDLARFGGTGLVGSVSKIHLNNSVEDPTLLHEWIGTELFHEAGLPAARSGHARLSINGRRLGLYVVKEGFTRESAARMFPGRTGEWFEPVAGNDVDGRLRPMSERGVEAQSVEGLGALAAAAALADREARATAMRQWIDPRDFSAFMAVEVLMAHRDGYTLARNNFRLFIEPATGRVTWVPHGMDQLFGQPEARWNPQMSGSMARAWVGTPAGMQQYSEQIGALAPRLLARTNVEPLIDQRVEALAPALSASEARRLRSGARDLKERIALRRASLETQLSTPPIPLAEFTGGIHRLHDGKQPAARDAARRHNQADGTELRLRADPRAAVTWTATVRLEPGRYRFEGRARTQEVAPLGTGRNQGASLRIRGTGSRSQAIVGTTAWTPLQVEFEVPAGGENEPVELVCELRASAGEAWFEEGSLRLVKRAAER